tara:strand:- start:4256 stop:6724 length:2469 start_codon:yes stop_codon:yes gene_type:complete
MKKIWIGVILLFIHALSLNAQNRWDAARIQLELEKLQTVGNVLYLAAHPDDENTKLIAWLANEKKVRTAYLSLTRGDGGQNLIGDEKGPHMGLVRTQELLEARKLDGGEQFFTRALDFGYSKNSDETFEKWEHDSILKDVVMTIRKFKPDVIITRFPPNNYAGHGHHSASAILAEEAFDIVNDPTKFPESAKQYGVWQPTRLFFNNSSWWEKDLENRKDEFVTVDVGSYNPLLGLSYSELAGMSRSQHRSQGFGAPLTKGEQIEYLTPVKGELTTASLFENIDITWNRIEGGSAIDQQIEQLLNNYNPYAPEKSVDGLLQLYFSIEALPKNNWKGYKLNQVKELIAACGGLWMEFLADAPTVTPKSKLNCRTEIITQSDYPFSLKEIIVQDQSKALNTSLGNTVKVDSFSITAPKEYTQPYWLKRPAQHNMYQVNQTQLLGMPENPSFIEATFVLTTSKGDITFNRPLRYKWVDRADGELYRNVNVVPSYSVSPDQKALVFTDGKPKAIAVKILAKDHAINHLTIVPVLPPGWKSSPQVWKAENGVLKAGELAFASFQITPPKEQEKVALSFKCNSDEGSTPAFDYIEISYPHIETQVVMPITEVMLVNAPAKIKGKEIGYIMGAGDEVPAAIEQLGYHVTPLNLDLLTREQLSKYDVVVVGIRAFNTQKQLVNLNSLLFEYVENGGHMVVQYQTNRGLLTNKIAPYDIELSRDRVTVEEAPVKFLNPEHPVLNIPNQLTKTDFEGWTQERGLYFASSWDNALTPLFSWHDPKEKPLEGSFLVGDYGKGTYIFTGISLFRHLPSGVPGSYRLLANILSYGQE